MDQVRSFPLVIGSAPKVLILGSAPSPTSLQAGFYYAHRTNQFWPIICKLFHADMQMGYEEKYDLLKTKGIALWDVVDRCIRRGSSDGAIKEVIPHDIPSLLSAHTSISAICFNGAAAQHIYHRCHGTPSCRTYRLPSTSSARAMSVEKKLQSWSVLLGLIHQP